MTTPELDWDEVLRVLRKHGFVWVSDTRNHVKTRGRLVVVPKYRPIRRGTMRAIIEQSGIPPSEFETG